jgi:flagellar biosynthesis protein FliQ
MQPAQALLELAMSAALVAIVVSLPALLVSLLVGFASSFFQGLTQVQDHTLTFVPRLLAVLVAMALVAPWMGAQVVRFTLAAWSLLDKLCAY